MKKSLIVLILVIPLVLAQEITTYVNDYSGLLTASEKTEIESILKEIYDSGEAEYAIVIIDGLQGQDIEGYAYNLAEGNLGDDEKDNGLLLLIALQDRRYSFEVGRSLEATIPDIIAARIGRAYLEPNFKAGNYAKGIKEASLAIKSTLLGEQESKYYVTSEISPLPLVVPAIIILIAVIIIVISIVASVKSPRLRKRKDSDFFTAAWLASRMMRGGGSGGFGGFGGGSFGGGGASGGWIIIR